VTSPYKVSLNDFNKSIVVPTSKSYANRVLILGAITPGVVQIHNLPKSSDVETMLSLLKSIGLDIDFKGTSVCIKNSFPECEGPQNLILNTGDGGTTNRFLLPLLARGKNEYTLEAKGHMRKRPMAPLVKGLQELGVSVTEGDDYWLRVKGPMNPSKEPINIDCSDSTQFLTGLTLATADKDILINAINLEASLPYFLMTKKLVEEFKSQKKEWTVPVDFSGLSYPLALACTLGKIKVENCHEVDLFQADSIFLKILEEAGASPEFIGGALSLEKPEFLMPFEADGSKSPDLVPTLAFLASYASGASIIRDIEILRHKESDRVEEVLSLLDTFCVEYEFDKEKHNLIIYGDPTKKIGAVQYHPPEDHRIIMVAYLYMRMNSGGTLYNAEHVKKSFPDFFETMGTA
jgi:3-phosphoshikimate 1-carboxyvinyltransferase